MARQPARRRILRHLVPPGLISGEFPHDWPPWQCGPLRPLQMAFPSEQTVCRNGPCEGAGAWQRGNPVGMWPERGVLIHKLACRWQRLPPHVKLEHRRQDVMYKTQGMLGQRLRCSRDGRDDCGLRGDCRCTTGFHRGSGPHRSHQRADNHQDQDAFFLPPAQSTGNGIPHRDGATVPGVGETPRPLGIHAGIRRLLQKRPAQRAVARQERHVFRSFSARGHHCGQNAAVRPDGALERMSNEHGFKIKIGGFL